MRRSPCCYRGGAAFTVLAGGSVRALGSVAMGGECAVAQVSNTAWTMIDAVPVWLGAQQLGIHHAERLSGSYDGCAESARASIRDCP
jgi:hypothetical protein